MKFNFYLVFLLAMGLAGCNVGDHPGEAVTAPAVTLTTQEQLRSLAKRINDLKLQAEVIKVINTTTHNHADYLKSIVASSLEPKRAELSQNVALLDEINEDRQKLNQFLNGKYDAERHNFRISFNYYDHQTILLKDFTQARQRELQIGLDAQEQQVQSNLAALKLLENDLAILNQIIELMQQN